MGKADKDKLSKAEAQRRFEATLRGALETPPKPLKEIRRDAAKPPRKRKSKYS